MKKVFLFILIAIINLKVQATVGVGKQAPDFEVKDAAGKVHRLSDYKNKWVVLEWYNKDCPFVKKHYSSHNMQNLQRTYTAKGVVWFSVISSAKGKQGYLEPEAAFQNAKEVGSYATGVLLDPTGTMGKAYGAKTTPHLFIIDSKGQVIYTGAIDNNDSSDPRAIATSKNYVSAALEASLSGKKVEVTSTRSYGCGVKYP